jgi:uncharacterized protein (TIGR03067 family)
MLALVPALALVTFALGRAEGEKDSIQGVWKVTGASGGGKDLSGPFAKTTITFAAEGKLSIDDGGGKPVDGTYKVVDDKKKPHQLDLTFKKGDKSETAPTIYEVTGDTLKIGFPSRKADPVRPESFDKAEIVMTLKRESK